MAGNGKLFAAALAGILLPASTLAQQSCKDGVRVDGLVLDPNGSAIAGARVQVEEAPVEGASTEPAPAAGTQPAAPAAGAGTTTDATGHFLLPCVPAGSQQLTAEADGFAPITSLIEKKAGESVHLHLQLSLARVDTTVQVGEDASAIDPDHGAGTHTLTQGDVAQLADDPDDFQRQLQVLAATSGGSPGSATITVDGFQNGSALPPKSSIASIRVNPDMFSSEYEDPPYDGGRIEIFTKPGVDLYHGALFFTDSDGSFNATDPFSVTATPAGKRRYGFELSGPVVKKKSDFNLALEKRDIDEFNVVNAVTLDANDEQTALHQTVDAPQRLWIASARGDLQATPTDVATLSFSANVNNLGNQGVGGLTLVEAGYATLQSEYDLRLSNIQTVNPNLLHETRIGYTWKRTEQTPSSTAPALQVAGYFNGGGATSQNLNDRERDLEIDDDVLLTRGKHSWKIGAQSLGIFVHDFDPDTFNGAYVFGGSTGPALDANGNPTGPATTLQPIEQYRRALLNLPGGTPTTFQRNLGTPLVPFNQWRLALYAQDTIKLLPRLTVSAGLRYAVQTTPTTGLNFDPRVGIAWSPDRKSTWVLHARAGLFSGPLSISYATAAYRLNGVRQQEALVYSPSFATPLTPIPGSDQISTVVEFPHSFQQPPSFQAQLGAEHDFPHHWHAQANMFFGEEWNGPRERNINAPLVPSGPLDPDNQFAAYTAPRPLAPNEDILQFQNSGHLGGNVVFLGLDQHSYKRFGFFAGYVHLNFTADTGRGAVMPQSSYTDAGEYSRPDWQQNNQFFMFGNLDLPEKVQASMQLDASSGHTYNVITGTDANGDGDFNDRPSYASTPGPGVYATRFGLLNTDVINGDVPRNLGTTPALVHMDVNLSRAWKLWGAKDAARTLTLNARSANLLNHTNVTAVGTVVSSPTFSESLAAEAARRIELGARFAF